MKIVKICVGLFLIKVQLVHDCKVMSFHSPFIHSQNIVQRQHQSLFNLVKRRHLLKGMQPLGCGMEWNGMGWQFENFGIVCCLSVLYFKDGAMPRDILWLPEVSQN